MHLMGYVWFMWECVCVYRLTHFPRRRAGQVCVGVMGARSSSHLHESPRYVYGLMYTIHVCQEKGGHTCCTHGFESPTPNNPPQKNTPQSAAGGELAGLFLLEHQGEYQ